MGEEQQEEAEAEKARLPELRVPRLLRDRIESPRLITRLPFLANHMNRAELCGCYLLKFLRVVSWCWWSWSRLPGRLVPRARPGGTPSNSGAERPQCEARLLVVVGARQELGRRELSLSDPGSSTATSAPVSQHFVVFKPKSKH